MARFFVAFLPQIRASFALSLLHKQTGLAARYSQVLFCPLKNRGIYLYFFVLGGSGAFAPVQGVALVVEFVVAAGKRQRPVTYCTNYTNYTLQDIWGKRAVLRGVGREAARRHASIKGFGVGKLHVMQHVMQHVMHRTACNAA